MSFTLPNIADVALAGRNARFSRWIEVEGLPYGFGTEERADTWFAARSSTQKLKGIRPVLAGVPQMLGSQIDVLGGGAMTSGSVTFNLLDIDGLITSWANIATPAGVLSSDFLAGSTTPSIQGLGAFVVGELLYIGTETVEVVSTSPLTVARGQFWSKAEDYGAGFPVGRAPYTFANRRVRYFNIIHPAVGYEPTDADKFLRFQGAMKQLSLGTNRAVFDLRADALDKEIDRQAFQGGGNITIDPLRGMWSNTIPNTAQLSEEEQIFYSGAWNVGDIAMVNEDLEQLGMADGQWVLLKVDDEIIAAETKIVTSSSTGHRISFLWLRQRGVFGTRVEEHKGPMRFREVLSVTEKTTTGEADQLASFFAYSSSMPARADHPLCILLSAMLSTGDGLNIYDTLPKRWGLGVSEELVDVAGIEAAIREDPGIRFRGYIDEPQNFVSFARELLKFAGFYFFIDNGGVFTIRKLRPPLPENFMGYDAGNIDGSMIVSKRPPKWTSNWESAVQDLVFKFGWDGADFKRITVFTLADARIFAKGSARTISIESRIVGPNVGGGVGGAIDSWDVDSWLLQRADYFRTRYGKPTPILDIAVDLRGLKFAVGDVVTVTNGTTPNVAGARGLNFAQGEVVAVIPEETSHTMRLMVLMMPSEYQAYRYFAPCGKLYPGQWSFDGFSLGAVNFKPCFQDFAPEFYDSDNGGFLTQANQQQIIGYYFEWDLYNPDWSIYMRRVTCVSNGDGTMAIDFSSSPDFTGIETLADNQVLVPSYYATDPDSDFFRKFAWHDFDPAHRLYPL